MGITHQFFDSKTNLNDNVFEVSKASRVKQIHSNDVVEISTPLTDWVEADAIVTRTSHLPIGVITADCAPVLFYGDNVIGASHAGWQGALSGVLESTIETMNCDLNTIKAYIGPCISQKSYEVSKGFEIPFLDHAPVSERFFMAGKSSDKLQFDLAGYCAFRLTRIGITKIQIDGRDTVTHPDFHSHRGGATTAERNLSAIMIIE